MGGGKTGERVEWYEWTIPEADDLYDEYLGELSKEGSIE